LDYAGYHHPALDSLFASARRARDVPAQQAAWQAIDRWLADESPVAWLYHARGIQGIHRRLQGVRMDLRGELATLTSWHLTSPH
jgi:peptide/nickel transport system substrate-binding protein